MYVKLYIFWNGNKPENPFLISNLAKNEDVLRKWLKNRCFVKKNSWTAYKTQFKVKNAEIA